MHYDILKLSVAHGGTSTRTSSEGEGREFESRRVHQLYHGLQETFYSIPGTKISISPKPSPKNIFIQKFYGFFPIFTPSLHHD